MTESNIPHNDGHVPDMFAARLMSVLRTAGELAPETEAEVRSVEGEIGNNDELPAFLLNEVALSEEIISNAAAKILPFQIEPVVTEDHLAYAARLGSEMSVESVERVLDGALHKRIEEDSVAKTVNVLSHDRKIKIAALAERVFDSSGQVVPVNLDDILLREGVTCSFGHFGDSFDGLLECKNRTFRVYCNRDRGNVESSPRAKFTIAHELGHYFIDEHRWALESGRSRSHGSLFGSSFNNHLIEKEANLFAASLLVPAKELTRRVPSLSRGLTGIVQAAEIFDVSIQCAAIQMAETGVGPCALFFWNEKGHRWKWSSPSFYAAGYRKGIADRSVIPADSATGLAFREQRQNTCHQIRSSSTVASFWFPNVRQGSDNDVLLKEEAMCLGAHGVLTVIFA